MLKQGDTNIFLAKDLSIPLKPYNKAMEDPAQLLTESTFVPVDSRKTI
jgi:hypothetical protein